MGQFRAVNSENVTFDDLAAAYLEDYELQQYRTIDSARGRVASLKAVFGGRQADSITAGDIRQYQLLRRQKGMSAATVNRETSALSRMFHLAIRLERLDNMPRFPERLEENPPRQGFFEHKDYLKVRMNLPPSYQDVLDFAYYSGWRRREITELTWEEVDLAGGVVRLAPLRSKTKVSRVLPISTPLKDVLKRREKKRLKKDIRVFKHDGVTVRQWKVAWNHACQKAGVPERVAMLLTGHKTRCVFDRYNIVNERELATAGERLADYLDERAASARQAF